MLAEQQTEWIINNKLVNKGWQLDGDSHLKNVYFQKPKSKDQRKKLRGKKPDYILYQTGTDRPIAIIEAKKGGVDLEPALKQAREYAQLLDAPLVFAMNSSYCEARFVSNNKSLMLNGEEVRELIKETEVLKFIEENTNEIYTLPKQIIISRNELIKIFKDLNDTLRGEGLRAGIERFSEFANILFLKLMSENNKKSWWNSIKSQDNDDSIGYINSYVIDQIKNEYGGDVFTPLQIKNPKTLCNIIARLDPLVLSTIDTDVKGDAFEYFIKQTTSTTNDLGEYFTPRHIIRAVINLVAPKFKEKIYDPFCGTGGFLTESYNTIKENTIIEDDKDLERLKQHTLYGGEITTTSRIAKMNMILHGDGHSGVKQVDSLGNPIDGNYDIVMTNIPFSQTTEFGNLYYNGISRKNGDSACILHCLRALKKGGRMALIVPEGVLFRKDIARVREFLLKRAKLQLVISLPQGAFLPYTGVKTDILYFTNAHHVNNQKNYWVFEVKNDGYSLDNHRRPLKGKNDLHKVAESDFKKVEKDHSLKDNLLEIGFEIIDLEKVKQNDYNLVGSVYRELVYKGKYELISLFDALDILETGKRPKGGVSGISEGAISLGGEQIGSDGKLNLSKIPFVPLEFFNKSKKGFVEQHDILICKDGALTGKACFVDIKFPVDQVMINEHVYIMRAKKNSIVQKYLFFCLLSQEVQSQIKRLAYNKSGQPGLNQQHIRTIKIPLPTIEEQHDIIKKLDTKQNMIEKKKQELLNLQKQMDYDTNSIWQSEEES